MKTRQEIKEDAKQLLKGNWRTAIIMCIPYYLASAVQFGLSSWAGSYSSMSSQGPITDFFYNGNSSVSFLFDTIVNFLFISISYGFFDWIISNKKPLEPIKEGVQTFSKKYFTSTLALFLIQGFFIILWTILLIIPGIIKSYSYSQTYFVYKSRVDAGEDNPGFIDAITKSRQLMDGHKFDYFVLQISFAGWFFLSMVTLGIGFIWLVPYYNTARANFYYELVKADEANNME